MAGAASNLPALFTPAAASAPSNPAPSARRTQRQAQAFDAQVMGQGGARRGLRGGAPVLNAARSAYLDAEWRGEGDRRLPAGTLMAVDL